MSSPSPTNASSPFRLQPVSTRDSLRRIRTAFSLSPRTMPSSSTTSPSTSSYTSPLASSTSEHFSGLGLDFGSFSTQQFSRYLNTQASEGVDPRRIIRRKKSLYELEQEEERALLSDQLVGLVEPRPHVGPAWGGIEEVLNGRI